jgi:hypothetical protein
MMLSSAEPATDAGHALCAHQTNMTTHIVAVLKEDDQSKQQHLQQISADSSRAGIAQLPQSGTE